MIKQKLIVKNKTGLHARPASILAKTISQYQSTVTLIYNEKTIKGKSVMGLISAGISGGSTVEICCEGPDEQAVFNAIEQLFNTGFGEL